MSEIDASHLNGWTRAAIQDRAPDDLRRGKEAEALWSKNLGRGHAINLRKDRGPEDVAEARIFLSRYGDGDPDGADWEHVVFVEPGGGVIGEYAYPT